MAAAPAVGRLVTRLLLRLGLLPLRTMAQTHRRMDHGKPRPTEYPPTPKAEDSITPLLTRALAGEPVEKLPPTQRAMVRMALATAHPQIERLITQGRRQLEEMLPGIPHSLDRHTIWCWLMGTFFRYPQGLVMMLLVGLLAPPLVSRDVGSRAFLLYFSRPIRWQDYLVGKLAILWAYLGVISAGPALALYLFGVLLSPSLVVLEHTWAIPFRILAGTAVLIVPTSILALAFSSLSSRSWVAGFTWFAVWFFGYIGYQVLWLRAEWAERWDPSFSPARMEHWSFISSYHVLRNVEGWFFGVESSPVLVQSSAGLLAGLTVVSLAVLRQRIAAPSGCKPTLGNIPTGKEDLSKELLLGRKYHFSLTVSTRPSPYNL